MKKDEDVEGIVERMNNIDKEDMEGRKELAVIMGFFIFPNLLFHIISSFVINIIVCTAIYYLFDLFSPLLSVTNYLYILGAVLIFTLLDYLVKYLVLKFSPKIMFFTFGFVFFVMYFLYFWFIDFIMRSSFNFINLSSYFLFVVVFGIVKLLLTIIIRRVVTNHLLKKGE